jgi:hypothetical protein
MLAMLDEWQPRQFLSSVSEIDAETFLSSFGNVPFLLVDIEEASDRLVSGLFHTSPLIRHDTPLVEELTGATDLGPARELRHRRKRPGLASSLATEIMSDPAMHSRFLAPLSPRVGGHGRNVVTIGRNLGNDVILKHQSISRVHATFERQDEGLALTDMGSKNGSWLNGARFTGTRRVESGDSLKFGQIEAVLCDAEVLWQIVHPDVSSLSGPFRG